MIVIVDYDNKDKINTSKVIFFCNNRRSRSNEFYYNLTRKITKGLSIQYKNGDIFIFDTNEKLVLNITFYG